MRLDCVFFELEGILVETAVARRMAVDAALRESGSPIPSSAVDAAFAESAPATFDRLAEAVARQSEGGMDATDTVLLALRAERIFSSSMATGATLVDGAREKLEELASRTRLAVVTRASRQVARRLLELAELETATVLVASDDPVPPKPSGRPYELALSRLPGRGMAGRPLVVALEDCHDGAVASMAAGVPCVRIGSGVEGREMVTGGASATLPSLERVTWEMLASLAGERMEIS